MIAKLTLVYPCKPLENGLSRILYTWILLDVFLTFVRPKDVIRLKIRLFILRHPSQFIMNYEGLLTDC